MEEFAKNEYASYLVLDFAQERKDVLTNFEENMGDLDTFFRNLFLLKGKELKRGNSVIIFDEVQLFPIARQAVKYLVKDGRYHYIETGSLITIKKNVKDILIPSEPIWRLEGCRKRCALLWRDEVLRILIILLKNIS